MTDADAARLLFNVLFFGGLLAWGFVIFFGLAWAWFRGGFNGS